jgi:hypothetical protein
MICQVKVKFQHHYQITTTNDRNTYVDNYKVNVPNNNINLKINKNKPFEICIYQVFNKGKYPFLLFLLKKLNDNNLSFFEFINNSNNFKK